MARKGQLVMHLWDGATWKEPPPLVAPSPRPHAGLGGGGYYSRWTVACTLHAPVPPCSLVLGTPVAVPLAFIWVAHGIAQQIDILCVFVPYCKSVGRALAGAFSAGILVWGCLGTLPLFIFHHPSQWNINTRLSTSVSSPFINSIQEMLYMCWCVCTSMCV